MFTPVTVIQLRVVDRSNPSIVSPTVTQNVALRVSLYTSKRTAKKVVRFHGYVTPPNSAIYTGTKGAVDAITQALAKELGPRKIRINAVNPGGVETEGFHALGFSGSDFEKQMIAQTPLGRLGQPQDVAPVVAFLASSEAEWITGETIRVAGGFR